MGSENLSLTVIIRVMDIEWVVCGHVASRWTGDLSAGADGVHNDEIRASRVC